MVNGISSHSDLSSKLLAAQQRQVERAKASPQPPSPQQDSTPGSGISVVLSLEAKAFGSQPSATRGDWQKTVGEHGILLKLASQIQAFGKDAELLKEKPNSDDPGRLELAEQAANFVVSGGDNPFSGVARKTLSNIAYDESGTFTAAERSAAMSEISVRDGDFWSKTSDLVKDAQGRGDNRAVEGIITQANLKLLSGMSETEKSMHSFTEDSLEIKLGNLAGAKIPTADYENISSSAREIFTATRNSDGKATWSNFSLDVLESTKTTLDLVTPTKGEDTAKSDTASSNGWLTVYARISKYQD